MLELFDEVDTNDEPTGRQVTKQEAHDEKIIHRCAVIYIFDRNGKLYLQRHKASNNRLDHSAGGHVISGETYAKAATRELKEELGLEVKLREISSHFLSKETSTVHMYSVFIGYAPKGWVFKPNHEVETLVETTLSDLLLRVVKFPEEFTSGLKNTLPLVCEQL